MRIRGKANVTEIFIVHSCVWELLLHCVSSVNNTDNNVKVIERECETDVKISLYREISGLANTDNQPGQSP